MRPVYRRLRQCDEEIGRPARLIAYDTDINMVRRKEGKPPVYRLIRPRTILYACVIGIVSSVMLYALLNRSTALISAQHSRNPLFVALSDGSVRNDLTVHISNKGVTPRTFTLGAEACRQPDSRRPASNPPPTASWSSRSNPTMCVNCACRSPCRRCDGRRQYALCAGRHRYRQRRDAEGSGPLLRPEAINDSAGARRRPGPHADRRRDILELSRADVVEFDRRATAQELVGLIRRRDAARRRNLLGAQRRKPPLRRDGPAG